jgi:hypothetical protein
MTGRTAYPDKVTMRVHVRLRDDLRLWGWAFAGAVLLFVVIVVLGIAPSPFASVGTGHAEGQRTIVVPDGYEPSAMTNHRPLRTTAPAHAAPTRRHMPAVRSNVAVGHQSSSGTQRPTPSPVTPTQKPDAPGNPTSASAPGTAAAPSSPTPSDPPPTEVPLPPTPDPTSVLPPLPTVTVPPVPDPTDAVPPLPLP